MADVLDAFVKIQDPDVLSLKADTAALRNKDFKAGMQNLKRAMEVRRNDHRWEVRIRRAEEKLNDALAVLDERDAKRCMQVEFNLALVYLALGETEEARYRLEQSTAHARRVLESYVQLKWWDILGAPYGGDESDAMLEDHGSASSSTNHYERVRREKRVERCLSGVRLSCV